MLDAHRSSFVYAPLSSNEIRLACITNVDDSSFTITLEKADIEDLLELDALALSYCWGPTEGSITVPASGNATTASVAPNLMSALTVLRKHIYGRKLWVDALCINQQDASERTQQVALMTKIYSGVSTVLIWLGPEDDKTPLAFQALLDCAVIAQLAYERDITDLILEFRQKVDRFKDEMDALVSLLDRDYWRRVWVIQEITLARDATILCGDWFITWYTFQAAIYFLERCAVRADLRGGVWMSLFLSREQYLDSKKPDPTFFALGRMLLRTRRHEATDLRDKVFALLGLIDEAMQPAFKADYSMNVREVFVHFTRELLLYGDGLGLFCAVQPLPPNAPNFGLPSWVPNWCVGWIAYSVGSLRAAWAAEFSAAGKSRAEVKGIPGDPDKISVRGIIVDEIAKHRWTDRHLTPFPSREYIARMAHILGLPPHDPHTGETTNTVFFRTITAGFYPPSKRCNGQCVRSIFPEYNAWASEAPQSMENMPKAVEIELTELVKNICLSRDFFITTSGYFGIGPMTMKVGDIVCVLLGSTVPFVLRRSRSENGDPEFELVGECYVHGIMDGEAIAGKAAEDFETFVLR